MKLSKYVGVVKREGYCVVNHVVGDGTWLGVRSAVYRATELPAMQGKEQVRAVLDIDSSAWKKIYLNEGTSPGLEDVFGMDLSDGSRDEQRTKKLQMKVIHNGTAITGLLCDDGELVFYDERLTEPLADAMKDGEYIETVVRKTKSGQPFVAIRDGFEVLAGIMPMKVVNKGFLDDLAEFEALCVQQFTREQFCEGQKSANEAEADSAGEQDEIENK